MEDDVDEDLVEVNRNGYIEDISPKDLTVDELCDILKYIRIDTSDEWFPETARRDGYAAINEAVRRLKNKG